MAEPTPAQALHTILAPRPPVPIWSRRVVGFPPVRPLIGREREITALRDFLSQPAHRLITVTGPGGVGKTRLALAVAATSEAEFADGAVFVPLASISVPALVLPAIAQALDIRENAERSMMHVLAAALRDRRILLVLDNFEQVVDAADDVYALLEACPGATALVTSRAPLRLHNEQRFATSPLTLPDGMDGMTPDDLTGYGAVGLFVERARMVNSEFALNGGNAAAVVEICRRLDGLPLAIELAAAWVRVLPPTALLARLEPRLPLLKGGTSDQPDRLRTMRDAIAWSYGLLSEEERTLLRRLAVFVGGFSLEEAEHLAEASRGGEAEGGRRKAGVVETLASSIRSSSVGPSPTSTTLDLLARLIDASLLQQMATSGPAPRFTLLETVREFAMDRLVETGEAAAIKAAHAAIMLDLAKQADPEMMGSRQAEWHDRLEAEHPNMRAALSWFLAQRDGERGLPLASAFTWFWSSRSYFREARTWLEAFLAMPTSAETRGRGLMDAANILHWQGNTERATEYADESLAIYQGLGDELNAAYVLRRLGSIAINRGDLERAAPLLAESREVLCAAGAAWDVAFADYLSGRLAVTAGACDVAVGHFAAAADAFRAIGDRGYVAAALGQQGAASVLMADLSGARTAYAESLALACEVRDQTWVAWALVGAAHLAHAAGELATATRLLAAATAIREAIGEGRLPKSALSDAVESSLGSERFSREWSRGLGWTESQGIAEARAILAGDGRRGWTRGDRRLADESTLTRRERDVLQLLVTGATDRAIGVALGLSRRTVSNHVGAILTKLGVESRAAAAAIAVRRGLL